MLRRRWPVASKVLLALAVLSGTTAFAVMRGYEARVEALRPAVGPPAGVVIAASGLAEGTVLAAGMLEVASVPEAYVPSGAFFDQSALVGRVLTARIDAGEILTASRLAAAGAGPVAALVPEGLRAVVVSSGVPAGMLRAGDRVDVYATYGGGRSYTELAASGLEVLRVVGPAAGTAGSGATATGTADGGVALVLLADPDAVQRLAHARAFAQLSVAILGPDGAAGAPAGAP